MSMQVEIMSKESIKPSSPTPPHLATFKFCYFDLLVPFVKLPMLLFYDNKDTKKIEFSDMSRRLKSSLSETLTSFYPAAGRINGNTSIECSDEGVDYIEARVKAQLTDVIKHPNVDEFLTLLLPSVGYEPLSKTLLAIQVNLFECGGIVICVCLSHKISDSYSLATFINSWAAKASNSNQLIHPISQQLSSLFPPFELGSDPVEPPPIPNLVTKRFVFDSSNIASLRAEAINSNASCVSYPTRVELVSAFLWRRFMELTRKKNGFVKECAAMHLVNLRKRMASLPLDGQGMEDTLGNLFVSTFTTSKELASKNELYELVGEIRAAIRKIDEEFVTKIRHGGAYIQYLMEEFSNIRGKTKMLSFSSWCRFPWYKADFGWGKPIWATTLCTKTSLENIVLLLDTASGDGIEAMVRMPVEDMAEFEQDEQLLSFLSPAHSVDC